MGSYLGDRRRGRAGVGAVLLALAAFGAPSTVAAAVKPMIAHARLEGQFLLAGRITQVTNVRGERKGQTVLRTWTFRPSCKKGACRTLHLTRSRQSGTDRLLLVRTKPGSYQGSGSFYAPLTCSGRTWNRGELVPFTVTVTVSAAARTRLGILATRVNATYSNRQRINHTPCVTAPGSDGASYHGHVVSPNTTGRRAALSGTPAQPGAPR